jgi:hypothetical protein
LQTAQHQDRRTRLLEPDCRVDRAHQLDQPVVHDLDDLLFRADALDQLRADRLGIDPRHQLLDDVVVNVGLEERGPDLAQTFLHVGFGQQTADTEPLEGR